MVVNVLNITTLIAGSVWLAVGVASYVAYRRNQGLSLTQTTKVVLPQPIVEHEVEYESVVVAFEDGHYSGEAIAMAVRLAARRRRGIHVLVTINVPANAPDRRLHAGRRGPGPGRSRPGPRTRWPARDRPLREGARRRGRTPDRERGRGDPRGGHRHAVAPQDGPGHRCSAALWRRSWPSGRAG
ncbi:MAG: hypothetical protein WKF40_08985 [Thermoleophilaceae bacterium]